MKNYLLIKSLLVVSREYIFIFLTATIFLFTPVINSFAEENVFTINNVKVKGIIDLNFSRDKYLNKAFLNSFETLMNKILLTRDFEKIRGVKLKEIKNLAKRVQIMQESYSKDEYNATFKMHYSEIKVKKF